MQILLERSYPVTAALPHEALCSSLMCCQLKKKNVYIKDNFTFLCYSRDYGWVPDLFYRVLRKSATAEPLCHFLAAFEELTEIQLKATNKGSLVLVWMMATLEPIPATYGHRAWLRAHKCYSPWTLCQPMAHRINGQFRAGGQACPQHYMA